MLYPLLFAGDDSFAGANRSAGTAIDAGIGVDVVDVAFRDGANGALGEAGAASYTFVGDYVCQGVNKYKLVDNWIKTINRVCNVGSDILTLQK